MANVFDAKPTDPGWLLIGKAVFGIGLALGAPFVAMSLVRTIVTASRSQSWPETTATITRSEVATEFPLGARGPKFVPKIEYRYAVGGTEYTSDRVALRALASSSKDDADAVAARYPVGTQHPAYYDPTSPAGALLERGTSSLTYVGLGIPLVLVVFGPYMAWEQIGELRRRSAVARPADV